jgi:hypothetical protein
VKLKNKAKKDSIERKKNWKMDLKKKKKKRLNQASHP